MGRREAEETLQPSRRSTWAAPSLLGHALAAARDGASSASGRPSSRRVISRRDRSRSRSLSRGLQGGSVFRRVQRTDARLRGSPADAAHRHVNTWLGDPNRVVAGTPRTFMFSSGKPSARGDRGARDELWTHDLWEGGDGEVGSAVFVRGLPTDITHQEVTSNFAKCGRIVAVKLDARGGIVTAEVSFAQKGAAAVATKTFHGVSVQSRRGKDKYKLKVAVLDQTQQPGAVEQIEEDDIPKDGPTRFVVFRGPGPGGPLKPLGGPSKPVGGPSNPLGGPPRKGPRPGGHSGRLAADAAPVSIFDRLT